MSQFGDIHADPSVRPELVQALLYLTDPNGPSSWGFVRAYQGRVTIDGQHHVRVPGESVDLFPDQRPQQLLRGWQDRGAGCGCCEVAGEPVRVVRAVAWHVEPELQPLAVVTALDGALAAADVSLGGGDRQSQPLELGHEG